MAKEIERKFLLNDLPFEELQAAKPHRILQGYLFLEEERELRVRRFGNRFYITQKSGSGLVREENEQEIEESLFDIVWPFTEGKRLEKLRFSLTQEGYHCVVDVYNGNLTDLMVMEVEFETEAQARSYTPPTYVVREITEDKRFKNASLALFGKPDDNN